MSAKTVLAWDKNSNNEDYLEERMPTLLSKSLFVYFFVFVSLSVSAELITLSRNCSKRKVSAL